MGIKQVEAAIMRAIPQDKCLHVIGGAIVFALTRLLLLAAGAEQSLVFAFAAVAVVGAVKEITDHFDGGDCSIYDWLATCAGGLLGLACGLQLHGVL